MSDIGKEAVQRYSVKPWDIRRADVVRDDDGSLVSYDDYRAQSARITELEAAIKRQASAAKTLRDLTLSYVQHLEDKDRSEYVAAKTVDSEREANDILTDRVEQLEASLATARNDALRDVAQKYVDAALAYQSTPNDGGGGRGPKGQAMRRKTQAFSELQIALITEEPS